MRSALAARRSAGLQGPLERVVRSHLLRLVWCLGPDVFQCLLAMMRLQELHAQADGLLYGPIRVMLFDPPEKAPQSNQAYLLGGQALRTREIRFKVLCDGRQRLGGE